MATSSGLLQHMVHQPSAPPTEEHGEELGGMGPPPTSLGSGGGRTISPTTSITPPDASGMAAVNWGLPLEHHQQQQSMVVPTFPTKATGNPMVIASSGIRLDGTPQKSAIKQQSSFSANCNNNNNSTSCRSRKDSSSSTTTKEHSSSNNKNNKNRRQKRLERNRESARLSRMRRKQYLEVLEDRVNKLSFEMDKGRRQHVFDALKVVQQKRAQALMMQNMSPPCRVLLSVLSRTSRELRVASTFQTQQLQSLSLPISVKFLLWLTLQNDSFFRGGRAASERLSAARIGERMLTGGNDHVPPSRGMWPLLCNEVGLSYDQEERIRSFQRQLLLTPESWVHRHAGAASQLVMDSTHHALQAAMHVTGERERSVMGTCLTESQQWAMMQWSHKNAEKLARLAAAKKQKQQQQDQTKKKYECSDTYHDAANLYILHHGMQETCRSLEPTPTLVPVQSLKRLMRRPSFESLQSATAGESNSGGKNNSNNNYHRDHGGNRPLAREVSFSSEGSLKRSFDDLHCDDDDDMMNHDKDDEDRHTVHHVTPEEAQTAAGPAMEEALGFIQELVPPPKPTPKLLPDAVGSFVLPSAFKVPVSRQEEQEQVSPMVVTAHHPGAPQYQQQAAVYPPQVVSQQPQPMVLQEQPQYQQQQQPQYQVVQAPMSKFTVDEIPPFLPPNLNVVPEEGFLPGGGVENDDFLFELTEEDWAIGAGLDMDG